MSSRTVTCMDTSVLGIRAAQLTRLAVEVTGRPQLRGYLERRLSLYPRVVLLEQSAELQAFFLFDVRELPEGRHVYIGPLLSKEGGFVPLFEGFVAQQLAAATGALHFAVEIETPKVLAALRAVLPTFAEPRPGARPSPGARATAARFASRIHHVLGLQPATLKTHCSEPLGPTPVAQMMVFSVADSPLDRRRLISELRQGIERLETQRNTGRGRRRTPGQTRLRRGVAA